MPIRSLDCLPTLAGMRQVAHRLQAEFPGVQRLATLSPIPGFRAWLEARLRRELDAVRHSIMQYAYQP